MFEKFTEKARDLVQSAQDILLRVLVAHQNILRLLHQLPRPFGKLLKHIRLCLFAGFCSGCRTPDLDLPGPRFRFAQHGLNRLAQQLHLAHLVHQ